jgi:hypothetical protein
VSNAAVDDVTSSEARVEPAPWQVLPIIVLAPATGALLRWANGRPWTDAGVAAMLAAGGAGVLGLPVLVWLVAQRRDGPGWIGALGFVAGALTLVLIVLCGVIGLAIRHGVGDMSEIVRVGAPLPWFGQVVWARFAVFACWAGLVGATSAVVHASCFVRPRRAASLVVAGVTLALAMAVARFVF